MTITLTWWEWEELEAAIQERPDLWPPYPDHVNMYFRTVDDQPAYLLTAFPAPGASQFRLVQVVTKALSWPEEEVSVHLAYMRDKFTSYPFREDVEAFLRDELKHDPVLAQKAAIIIGRMQQGKIDLGEGSTSVSDVPVPTLAEPARFHLREGGVLKFRLEGGMLRCHLELFRPSAQRAMGGFWCLILDGFLRIQGMPQAHALRFLLGKEPPGRSDLLPPPAPHLIFTEDEL